MSRALSLCLVAFLVVSVWPDIVFGQSLGSVARKERERREKNKERGVEVKEFSETEIFGEDEDSDEAAEAEGAEPPEDEASDESAASRRVPPRIDIDVTPDESPQEDTRDRRRDEAEWRARFQAARDRLAQARERQRILSTLHLSPGESYVDTNGRVVVRDLAHLRRLVREADAEAAAAEKALKDLEEEARRAGVPPGWRR